MMTINNDKEAGEALLEDADCVDHDDLVQTSYQQMQSPQSDAEISVADNEVELPSMLSTATKVLGPVANLCSATLGAGILSIPYSLYQSGIMIGIILLIFSAVATVISIDMIVDATQVLKAGSYEELVGKGLGSRGRMITEIAILIFCEGVCVAYIIAVGDILGLLLGEQYRTAAMILSWTFTMLPLSLLRTMESLQWASSVGIGSILLLILASFQHTLQHRNSHMFELSSLLWPANGATSVLCALPMILFAFSCQVNVCAIYGELQRKEAMKNITRGAVGVCSAMYTSIAAFCLLDFGTSIRGNILLNYDPHDSSAIVCAAFGSMAVAVVAAFPLNVFPSRTTLEGIWRKLMPTPVAQHEAGEHSTGQPLLESTPLNEAEQDSHAHNPSESPVSGLCGMFQHVGFTLVIAGSAIAFALVLPNISVVFGLIGGSVSSLLGFILPGALAIATGNPLGWVMVVLGTLIGVVTTTVTIISMK